MPDLGWRALFLFGHMLLYLNFALLELLLPRPSIAHAIEPDEALPAGIARSLDHLTPQPIDDPEPANIRKYRKPQQEKRHQHQTGANRVERLIETRPDCGTENTASTLRQARFSGIVERSQRRSRRDQQQQAQSTKSQQLPVNRLVIIIRKQQQNCPVSRQNGHQIGSVTNQREKDIGEESAGNAAKITDRTSGPADRPARVAVAVGEQRHEHENAGGPDNYEENVPQPAPAERLPLFR